ncbi:hypothetical protein [Nocardiopsis lambiniae]|uniref:Uncharacterized protein n=1 Tax=Nocardiopsis lambiniae TaxID=3075539 RepID=A0ABU2MH14_9ACTN|nr:hypothetical protein [Nocardiopsis sp. DSM 44743]MDT0331541.1 hypothetical protein [Nocardiopsis sp. DSM 44743]
MVEAVARLLDGRSHAVGAVAPGEAFDAADFLAALSPEPLAVNLSEVAGAPRG